METPDRRRALVLLSSLLTTVGFLGGRTQVVDAQGNTTTSGMWFSHTLKEPTSIHVNMKDIQSIRIVLPDGVVNLTMRQVWDELKVLNLPE